MPADNNVTPQINRADLAAEYGWAMEVLKSDPSLFKVFNKAVKQSWTPQRFVAEVRSTPWFQKHSEAVRQATILQKTDPATWHERVSQTTAQLRDTADQMGAQISDASLAKIAKNSLMFGWNDSQIKDTLAAGVKTSATSGAYTGEAAVSAARLHEVARNNGINLSDQTVNSWTRRIAKGEQMSGFEAYIRSQAATAFPAWADQLAAGADVSDVASPYINSMAQTLELNPADIDLFDPTIRKAMQNVQPSGDGKTTIGAKPLWQFESELKQDKRWLSTDNARASLDGVAHKVLSDFGLNT